MKNFEPTENKIKKEKERGNLLRFDLLEACTFFLTASSVIYFWFRDVSLIGSYSSVTISILTALGLSVIMVTFLKVLINRGLWTKRENQFQFASNFKTFFKSLRKVLVTLFFMVTYILIVFYSVIDIDGLLQKVISAGFLLLGLMLCFEIIIESLLYKKSLMMDAKELKDEHKELEGDPYIRAALKQAHKVMLYEEVVARIRSSKYIVIG